MIEVSSISRKYGETTALNQVSFAVQEHELFGLIGADGAGKTSLFRILATLQLPDSGNARVGGIDLADYQRIRQSIGYMPGRFSLYQDLTVRENLEFFATVFGTSIEDNYDVIGPVYDQIKAFENRRAGALSGGMKQKLALSCALVHKPGVLLLDEPTTGVDPVSRKELWDSLKTLRHAGITILVSTPFMDEAALCDRVALIDRGNILAIDTPEGLTEGFGQQLLAVRSDADMYTLLSDLREFDQLESINSFGNEVHCTYPAGGADPATDLEKYLASRGHREIEVTHVAPCIEDVFIASMTTQGNA